MTTLPRYPSAYFMCSEAECQERQSSGEISIFESQWPPPSSSNSNSTTPRQRGIQSKNQSRRIVDPHFAMTKYRRSAAGVDTKNRTPPRSLEQSECCLDQLEYILCHQQQPPSTSSSSDDDSTPFPKQTLTGTVSFVEDRIRAIQVDMVVSQQPSASLQYRIAKCHIMILYLLGHTRGYETKFGHQALSAALTNYWDDHDYHQQEHQQHLLKDDEILCLMAMQQLCQYYQTGASQGQNDESSLSSILGYYRRNASVQQLANYPKFQWALHLVSLAVMGRPRSILRQLVELGQKNNSKRDESATPTSSYSVEVSESFAILCRCCMAPIVDQLRFQTLEQYNKSYMKGEKVKTEEVARLLYFRSAKDAGDFAEQMAGLTRNRTSGEDGAEDKIVFKVGPVNNDNDKLGKQQRRQDEFVFGACYGQWSCDDPAAEPLLSAWDDPEPPTASPTSVVPEDASHRTTKAYIGAITDPEGVLIPPPILLSRILHGEPL